MRNNSTCTDHINVYSNEAAFFLFDNTFLLLFFICCLVLIIMTIQSVVRQVLVQLFQTFTAKEKQIDLKGFSMIID